jgi:RimJ/RimL family protein N-acetyltransferase
MLQPTLQGPTLTLRPLVPDDFEELYEAASDPLIWAQHPSPNRYQRPVFEKWFADAIASKGALVAVNISDGRIIGSSRYYDWNEAAEEVAIGFTFLKRAYWGGSTNAEMKKLMLDHALQQVRTVWFHVGPNNIRSQKALAKIGAKFSHHGYKEMSGKPTEYFFYSISRNS